MNDCLKGLMIEERAQVAHKMNLGKGSPGHNCHLLVKQYPWVQKDLCTSFDCENAVLCKTKDVNNPDLEDLNSHSHLVLNLSLFCPIQNQTAPAIGSVHWPFYLWY